MVQVMQVITLQQMCLVDCRRYRMDISSFDLHPGMAWCRGAVAYLQLFLIPGIEQKRVARPDRSAS